MSQNTLFKCNLCDRTLTTKYKLEAHMVNIHEQSFLHPDKVLEKLNCSSDRCEYSTFDRSAWKKHIANCVHIQIDRALSQQRIDYEDRLTQLKQESENRFIQLKQESDSRIKILEKQIEFLESQVSQANQMVCTIAQRPTSVTNNISSTSMTSSSNSNNTNSNNHVNLVDGKTFMEMTDEKRVLEIASEKMEPYFLDGLRGVAVFLQKHVLTAEDGNVGVICTDFARKKIKYHNDKDELEEDIGASKFAKKLGPPIREAAASIHTTITRQIKEDKKANKIDEFWAAGRTKQADTAYLDISMIDNESKNSEFTNKFCALMKV